MPRFKEKNHYFCIFPYRLVSIKGFLMDQVRFSQASSGPLGGLLAIGLVRVLREADNQIDKGLTFFLRGLPVGEMRRSQERMGKPSDCNSSLTPVKERREKGVEAS